ncbi:MAG: T9SS type A sorting domain-containing protein [bacterium]|nr:T9SS type A sorting domain-containing protein [bacterium]
MRISACICLLLCFASTATAITISVPEDAPTIQAGVDAAAAGDTVLVAPGVYSGPGNVDIEISFLEIAVIGVGGAAATIIDCEGAGRGFYILMNENVPYRIQGFTIRNGDVPGSGGGIFCLQGKPALADLIIENCSSVGDGGGLYAILPDHLVIEDLLISECQSTEMGGGIYLETPGSTDLNRIVITDCFARVNGGGLFSMNASAGILTNFIISGCSTDGSGGGLHLSDNTATVIEKGEIRSNTSALNGGGIYVINSRDIEMEQVDIVDNGNGGIYCAGSYSEVEFRNGIIAFNHGDQHGIHAYNFIVFDISSSDIFGNTHGNFGGGIPSQVGVACNIGVDPLFCDLEAGDLSLGVNSECLPANNDCHELMGYLGMGCIGEVQSHHVPADYPTIQAAVDACLDGYTVIVAPGLYTGEGNKEIVLGNRDISLIGEGGSDVTVIDCEGAGRGFDIQSSAEMPSIRIQGISIINGSVPHDGAGIFLDAMDFTLVDIRIQGCHASSQGGGIYIAGAARGVISDLQITGCSAEQAGALYVGLDADLELHNSLIRGNSALTSGGIFALYASVSCSDLTLVENKSPAVKLHGGEFTLTESIIAFNMGSMPALKQPYGSVLTISCSDVFDNLGGNYCENLGDQTGRNGNISLDPRFCAQLSGVYQLGANSPCLPENNGCGRRMGMFGRGCDEVSDYLISGHVLDTMGEPLADVLIDTSGLYETRTDETGYYGMVRQTGWSDTATPVKFGYDMTPASRSYTDLNGDIPDQDFTATRLSQPHLVPSIFPDIQTALDFAVAGDTILVAPGEYSLAGYPGGVIDFLGKDVVLIGSGGSAQTTIINTDAYQSGLMIRGNESRALLIEGFTITGSSNSGVTFDNSSATLRDCIFRDMDFDDSYHIGGVLNILENSSPLIENCVFMNNSHPNSSLRIEAGTPEIRNTLFIENGRGRGGATQILGGAPVFSNVTFRDNLAKPFHSQSGGQMQGYGGAVYCGGESTPVFEHCLFTGNLAQLNQYYEISGYGGAMYIDNTCSPSISNCTFVDNAVETLQDLTGGHIFHNGTGTLHLEDTILAYAGNGGGIVTDSSGDIRLSNCNSFGNSGGSYIGFDDPTGDDCNIAVEPLFCDPAAGDYSLNAASPCLAAHNPCARLIGRYGQGCAESLIEISGRITDPDNQGLAFVMLHGAAMTNVSDEEGFYGFHVPVDWSGVITPRHDDFTFSPPEIVYSDVSADQPNQDYLAGYAVYIVPDDYPTIQEAMAVGNTGDSVLVRPGTYEVIGENHIEFGGRGIVLHALAGPDSTIIEYSPWGDCFGRAVWFNMGGDDYAEISGFTIRCAAGVRAESALCIDAEHVVVKDMIFDSCGGSFATGGAILVRGDGAPLISDCLFANNSAIAGGAISIAASANPTIRDCTFSGNHAGAGGAIFARGMELHNCVFRDNHATDGFESYYQGVGGAVYGYGNFTDVLFEDCSSYVPAIHYADGCGGAVYLSQGGSVMTRVSFLNCTSSIKGGGLYTFYSSVTLSECTFVGNSSGLAGDAIAFDGACVSMNACLVAFNDAQGGIWGNPAAVDEQIFTIFCSNVFMNLGGNYTGSLSDPTGSDGNISANPLLCDLSEGNMTLNARSPCLPANNICMVQMGAFGQGCDDTPVLLADFSAETEEGVVILHWSLGTPAEAPGFRLEATHADTQLELPWREIEQGSYEARNTIPGDWAGQEISYTLFGRDGEEAWFPLGELSVLAPEHPIATCLLTPYPNPFNPRVTIAFTLAESGQVRMSIFDLSGRRVIRLADTRFEQGHHELVWRGRDDRGHDQSSGIYLLRMEAQGYTKQQRLVMLR